MRGRGGLSVNRTTRTGEQGDEPTRNPVLRWEARKEGELEPHGVPAGKKLVLGGGLPAAFALAEVGRVAEGIDASEQAIQQAEALAEPYGTYHAYWALCAVHLERGEHERAASAARRTHRIGAGNDYQQPVEMTAALLGHAYALAGHVAEALELLEGLVIGQERRPGFTRHRDLFYPADADLSCGQLDEALRTAQQGLEVAQTFGQRGREAQSLRLLGEVHAARGDDANAEDFYHQGLTLGTELAMRPLLAHCHLGSGELCRRMGRREPAQEHLATATTMYREMDMRFWLEKAEAAVRTRG